MKAKRMFRRLHYTLAFISLLAAAGTAYAASEAVFFQSTEGKWTGPGEIVAGKYKGTKFTCVFDGFSKASRGMDIDGYCRVGMFSQKMNASVKKEGRGYSGRFLDGEAGEGMDITGGRYTANKLVVNIKRKDLRGILVASKDNADHMQMTISVSVDGRLIPVIGMRLDRMGGKSDGQKIANLSSIGAVCVVLALNKSLLTDGTYWLNLPATTADKHATPFPFLALVEHTNWMDKAHYNGDVLVYCGDYIPTDHEYFQLSADALAERFIGVLPQFNPAFKPDWVRAHWVFRAPYAQPVPGVNHSENIPAIQTPFPGLYWASMSQVYPWDRGTNYAVEIGRLAAQQALAAI